MNRKTLGGAAFLVAATFMGREALIWAFNKVLDAVSSGFRGGVSFVSLSWQNTAAIIFAVIGFALVLWPKSESGDQSQSKVAAPTVNYGKLLRAAVSIIERVRDHRSTTALWRDKLEPTTDIARAGLSTLLSFEKAGFEVPKFNYPYAESVAVGLEAYFSAIVVYLADGHIDEAKQIAVSATQRAEAAASAFNIDEWFYRDY